MTNFTVLEKNDEILKFNQTKQSLRVTFIFHSIFIFLFYGLIILATIHAPHGAMFAPFMALVGLIAVFYCGQALYRMIYGCVYTLDRENNGFFFNHKKLFDLDAILRFTVEEIEKGGAKNITGSFYFIFDLVGRKPFKISVTDCDGNVDNLALEISRFLNLPLTRVK